MSVGAISWGKDEIEKYVLAKDLPFEGYKQRKIDSPRVCMCDSES